MHNCTQYQESLMLAYAHELHVGKSTKLNVHTQIKKIIICFTATVSFNFVLIYVNVLK